MTTSTYTGIFGRLFRAIDTEVTMYRSDIVIDMNIIEVNIADDSECRFIHAARDSGTHMIPLPSKLTDNEIVPYLFGEKRPADILLESIEIMTHEINRNATLRYWNGNEWHTITVEAAIMIHALLADIALATIAKAA